MESGSTIGPAEAKKRWKQALDTYDDALFNADNDRWKTAVDRAYYSAFYGVLACLALEGETTKTHRGASMMFSKHFVKTNRVDSQLSGIFNNLMEQRVEADYAIGSELTVEEVEKTLDQTKSMLESLHEYLSEPFTDLPAV